MKRTSISEEARSDDDSDLLRYAHKVEVLGRMLDGIAHDLNNALTVMVMNLEVIHADMAVARKHGRRLELMNDAVVKSTKQVRRLLAFSRKLPLDLEILSLNEVIADLADLFEHALGDRIALQITPSLSDAQVRIDRAQLDMCLLTLIMNARAAMPGDGSIHIDLVGHDDGVSDPAAGSKREAAIRIRCESRMDGGEREFFLMDRSEDRFGLNAVRQAIAETGGRCDFAGAEVRIYLPVIAPGFES